jgi:hypothetical protein
MLAISIIVTLVTLPADGQQPKGPTPSANVDTIAEFAELVKRIDNLERELATIQKLDVTTQAVTAEVDFTELNHKIDDLAKELKDAVLKAQKPKPVAFFEYIQRIVLLIALIGGIAAAIAHWDTLFRPHRLRSKEREFDALEKAFGAVSSPPFRYLYSFDLSEGAPGDLLQWISKPIIESSISPFLPDAVRVELADFTKALLYESGDVRSVNRIVFGGDLSDFVPISLGKVFNAHEKLHNSLARALNCPELRFLFSLRPEEAGNTPA